MTAFDEMTLPDGEAREVYQRLARWLEGASSALLSSRRSQAELLFRRIGITFAVYGDKDATERLIPFDLMPRIFAREEWQRLERGLVQRVKALNTVPRRRLRRARDPRGPASCLPISSIAIPHYRPEMVGHKMPHGVYVHIAGIDIVRVDDERFLRSRGQCPHPLRRLLHAGEPRGDDAPLPRAVRRAPRRAGRELSGRAARHLALGRAVDGERRSDGRGADARPVQLRLLRALLPRRQARRRARRRARSLRARRRRLHAHHRRAAARRRDLSPHRRRFSRPARPSGRIRRSACPA